MRPELLPLPTVVAGERVRIRPPHRGDGARLFEAIDEDRDHLRAWLPWVDAHKTPDDTEAYVRKAHAWWMLREDLPLLVETVDGILLGGSGLHRFDWAKRSFEIGYWIRKSQEGRGLVSEAVELATAIAFVRLDADRVEIRCERANDRSAAVPLRLGFVEQPSVLDDSDGMAREMRVFAHDKPSFAAAPWSTRARARVEASDQDG